MFNELNDDDLASSFNDGMQNEIDEEETSPDGDEDGDGTLPMSEFRRDDIDYM